jgi:hypothetical protein
MRGSVLMRIMLDTMIYDLIADDPDLATVVADRSASHSITLISTHIQEDQLAAIPDPMKREAVSKIPRQVVPTSGAVWGVSKWDQCRWGDGTGAVKIAGVFKGNEADLPDALIGITTDEVDRFVTRDSKLRNRIGAVHPSILWSFEEFAAYVRA